MVELEARKKI